MDLFRHVDPRLRASLLAEWARRREAPGEGLPRGVTVVLAGHRAAGKSTLLPHVAALLGRDGVDLDGQLEQRHGRSLWAWVGDDVASFRAAEKAAFLALAPGLVVAVGGGFLASHPDALVGCVTVLVPVSYETYVERLSADTSRPRLRPDLPLAQELDEVWAEREQLHRRAQPRSLVDFLLAASRPLRARRVATLPPFTPPTEFAWRARHAGADVLEVRTDLTPLEVDLTPASRALPLLVAERGVLAPAAWRRLAAMLDTDAAAHGVGGDAVGSELNAQRTQAISQADQRTGVAKAPPASVHAETPQGFSGAGSARGGPDAVRTTPAPALQRGAPLALAQTPSLKVPAGQVVSVHAPSPLQPDEAVARWRDLPPGAHLKHVEPVGDLRSAARLFETQRRLIDTFGADRVTVLATGALALPFRALLAVDNALDYLALDSDWCAAPGQRLLADAVRASLRAKGDPKTQRLGILGAPLAHSRSPRLHVQPFDRIELPVDADVAALLEVLRPHYRGFAVTNPFKKRVASAVGASHGAVNTLVREADGYSAFNTDREGAAATLAALLAAVGEKRVTVLGDGGATHALVEAAAHLGVEVVVRTRADLQRAPAASVLRAAIWTWPATVEVPASLDLTGVTVAVIAYGGPARTIAATIRERGGTPLRLGPRWFLAQARRQKDLWESSI